MYNLILILSMLVVVLSPLLIDLLLSVQEVRWERSGADTNKEKGPQYAWASPRVR